MSISVEPAPTEDASPVARAERNRRSAHVLVALTAERTVPRALQEADAFARRLRAELHLLRVVPHVDPEALGPPKDLVQAVREAQRVLAAARHTRKVSDRVLSDRLPTERLCVRLGTFIEQVAQRACELDAVLIVIPPGTRHLAWVVTEVVRRTDCPVLVPKGCASLVTLLAATDLEDAHTPVLRKAAELGRALGSDVVALHSLVDTGGAVSAEGLRECHAKLERAARDLESRFESIVWRAPDAVQGILEQAHAHDAGLIVVGARARSDRAPTGTAAQLVRRARSSVLVAPLQERPDALPWVAAS
jgi:nucleotide-binding universal stress UspA family protein